MKIRNLEDLFVLKLAALYDIESEIAKALPKVARYATNQSLKKALESHLEETKVHVERIEQAFAALNLKPEKIDVDAIRGLVKDAEWLIEQKPAPEALDASIIASARYIEHYEMAGYLSAIAWADSLGYDSVADLLRLTLAEEEEADSALSDAAESGIDQDALPVEK